MCQMTNATRAKCKNWPAKRADGLPRLADLGDPITADHRTLNYDNTMYPKESVVCEILASRLVFALWWHIQIFD